MDRTSFQLPFSEQNIPKWPCPKCRVSHLTLVPRSLVYKETPESLREHEHDAWEPDWIRYIFSCIFECSNKDCNEVISCCGEGRVNFVDYEDEEHGWGRCNENLFIPKYFNPPLNLMDLPKDCPAEVVGHLSDSFALFFADPGAALNCARTAVEAVLTDLGIKRFSIAKGKRRPINLHQRIQSLPTKYDELKELLIAVKWLGNAGSHAGEEPTADDVRTTYDLLEHALSEIYEAKGKKLKAIAKKVNKMKGLLK